MTQEKESVLGQDSGKRFNDALYVIITKVDQDISAENYVQVSLRDRVFKV
jgi:hypothetical protein